MSDENGSVGGSVLFGEEARLDPGGLLRATLGRSPREDELRVWAGMPSDRREKTLARVAVLRRWTEEPGELTPAEAAEKAGAALSRFYEIVNAWKADPSIGSVGTFARKPGRKGERLNGEVVNRIQSVLPALVAKDDNGKVAAIVDLLSRHPALQGVKLPHLNTLRKMVEREKRRLLAEKQVGSRPGFDAVGCDLLREDGTHHVLFGVVDRTSRLILGFSVGRVDDSFAAYRRAARDALDRIGRRDAQPLPWSDETTRVDVVVGEDVDAWKQVERAYAADPVGPAFELIESSRRYGRYFKIVAGTKLGGMRIWPARTGATADAAVSKGEAYTDEAATTAIEIEIARHNAHVMAENTAAGSPRPAPETIRMLEFIARA